VMVEPRLVTIAEGFWKTAGTPPGWPRDLENAVALALPLATVNLPQLGLHEIQQWLEKRGVPYKFPCQDRRVRGCLVAYRGPGAVFIDGSDPQDERRFTLAHEVSHFLLDYHLPRQRARQQLGSGILDILDGLRSPTVGERVEGLLNLVSVAPHVHFLEQQGDGSFVRSEVWHAENRADQLAIELLAPLEAVSSDLVTSDQARMYSMCLASARGLLTAKYGLPTPIAQAYARAIAEELTGGPSILAELGLE
jgi:hypothetical protein